MIFFKKNQEMPRCRTGSFQCIQDGHCFPERFRCDDKVDCIDASDESKIAHKFCF